MKTGRLLAPATALAALISLPQAAFGLTVFVDEDFESYGSQGAFEAEWPAYAGDGISAAGAAAGQLVSAGTGVENQTGNAITGGAGLINEQVDGWHPGINTSGYLITPSATEDIVVRGDMFISAETGTTHRQTIGLRSDIFDRDPGGDVAFGVNLVEMGTWNGNVCPPTAPGCELGDPTTDPPIEPDADARIETDLSYRLTIFDIGSLGDLYENGVNQGAMEITPNWQYFPLNPDLDLPTTTLPNGSVGNESGRANLADIGDGWHTFQAVIGEETTTLTLDLFRDGIDNVTGEPGVDSTVVLEISMARNYNDAPFDHDPSPMNSLRIGSPSGVSSESGVASFDNLYLALEDVAVGGLAGDYNDDGVVDAADYTVYRDTLGETVDLRADGNDNGAIDPGDYTVWSNNFGATASAASAVPEPSTLLLIALPLAVAGAARRHG